VQGVLGNGGGVCTDTPGTFTMSGGTITDNTAETNGNGVYVGDTFNVDITGTADSVYLPQGKVINVISKFTGKISGIVSKDRDIGTNIVSFNSPVQGSSEDRKYFQLDETLTEQSLGLTYDATKNVLELAPTYTVSFQAYEGTPEPEDQTVTRGDPVDEPTTLTKDGHTFAGWHKDTTCTEPWNFDTDTVTSDLILHAKWTPNKPDPEPPSGGGSSDGNMDNAYRVLFNDGAATLYVVTDLSAGDKLTKPEDPVKDGYTFAGWHKDTACTQAWDFNDGITGSMTLYAKWTPQETVTPTATATVTPTVTATTTITSTPTGDTSPAPTSQPDDDESNGDNPNGETTTTPGISLPYLIGGIAILLLAILLLLFLLLRHTVTFLIPTGGEITEHRIKVWHGRYINTEDLPDLIRTAAWYRDTERQERWDFNEDRVTKSIELYLG
ncbi:MAG TPA: InlB B-repeat-containing protein, partial [Methanocorpusculum sp.]|nr:InlB B-repeat-containing protein [Methanocorpusculum sp.]